MKHIKMSLLLRIVIAILLGIGCSYFFPEALARVFVTINSLFGNFLNFIIPLLILGLVAPGIAELGRGAGKMLGVTTLLAYGSTVLSGYFSYGVCGLTYPMILEQGSFSSSTALTAAEGLEPYFVIDMPPLFGVMSALILSFVLGLALTSVKGNVFRTMLCEFREVIMLVIRKVIIPLLPLYIFGIFLKMGVEGTVMMIVGLFLKVIIVIFVLHIVLLLIQFCIAGAVAGKNPLRCLKNMLPAYMTALGTQSSAATIPVTLADTSMRYNTSVRQYSQDCSLCFRHLVHDRNADRSWLIHRVHLHAGYSYGGGPGSAGRGNNGFYRDYRFHSGFQ